MIELKEGQAKLLNRELGPQQRQILTEMQHREIIKS